MSMQRGGRIGTQGIKKSDVALGDINDVDLVNADPGDSLVFDGTRWVPVTLGLSEFSLPFDVWRDSDTELPTDPRWVPPYFWARSDGMYLVLPDATTTTDLYDDIYSDYYGVAGAPSDLYEDLYSDIYGAGVQPRPYVAAYETSY